MKGRILESLAGGLLIVIFALIVVHAPLSVGFGSLFPDFALIIKSWKEILMIFATICIVVIATTKNMWILLSKDKLFWLIVGYSALHFVMIPIFDVSLQAVIAGLSIDLRYLLFFGLVYVFLLAYPQWRDLFLKIVVGGALVVLGFSALQLFLPHDILRNIGYSVETIAPYGTVDRNYDFIRINSTMRGPNPLGAYAAAAIALMMAFVASRNVKKITRREMILTGLIGLLGVIALWVSYSRSAAMAAVVAVMIVIGVKYGMKIPRMVWAGTLVGLVIVASLILTIGRENSTISNIVFHEDPEEGNMVNSNDGHIESLQHGTGKMLEQPFGLGVGSTGSASLLGDKPLIIENQYLFIAHEVGWLGLALFVAIFVMVMIRLWMLRANWWALGTFAGGAGLAVIGILLPVWVDDTVSILWWGLAAVCLAKGAKVGKTKQKTA